MKTQSERIKVSFADAMRILLPYSWHHIAEQLVIVAPVCLYMALFQFVILHYGLTQISWIVGGISLVILGLAFFLEGVRIGLVPLGEAIGDTLPARSSLTVILIFSFILGIFGAFGEPVVGSLQIAGSGVNPEHAPLLYALLVKQPMLLTLAIALGVGVAVSLASLRFIRNWSLKPFVLGLIGVCIFLSLMASRSHNLSTAIGLAWDSGAVIVGPVLCPLVLSLGLGICRATGKSDSGMAGFGTAALISIVPIATVTLLTYLMPMQAEVVLSQSAAHSISQSSPSSVALDSFMMAIRAIAPIFIFLYLFLRFWLKEEGIPFSQLFLGALFALVGLFLFNFGLSVGLDELGNQVGNRLPNTFFGKPSSLYPSEIGKVIVVIFGLILGYGATLAEPAFNVLGQQVEDVTQGAFKKWLFCQAVAIGVGVGAGFGMASLIYKINLLTLLIPPYFVLLILTIMNDEKYVNIAWDGGAVTTGPVTVPLKIAIGIALSHATGFSEGFGILALASAYPVMNILLIGLYVKRQQEKVEASVP